MGVLLHKLAEFLSEVHRSSLGMKLAEFPPVGKLGGRLLAKGITIHDCPIPPTSKLQRQIEEKVRDSSYKEFQTHTQTHSQHCRTTHGQRNPQGEQGQLMVCIILNSKLTLQSQHSTTYKKHVKVWLVQPYFCLYDHVTSDSSPKMFHVLSPLSTDYNSQRSQKALQGQWESDSRTLVP